MTRLQKRTPTAVASLNNAQSPSTNRPNLKSAFSRATDLLPKTKLILNGVNTHPIKPIFDEIHTGSQSHRASIGTYKDKIVASKPKAYMVKKEKKEIMPSQSKRNQLEPSCLINTRTAHKPLKSKVNKSAVESILRAGTYQSCLNETQTATFTELSQRDESETSSSAYISARNSVTKRRPRAERQKKNVEPGPLMGRNLVSPSPQPITDQQIPDHDDQSSEDTKEQLPSTQTNLAGILKRTNLIMSEYKSKVQRLTEKNTDLNKENQKLKQIIMELQANQN